MTIFELNPVMAELQRVLDLLEVGGHSADELESRHVDLKEEAGRRSRHGMGPSNPQSPEAATHLAEECACMANTPGGGALVVGVSDDGNVVGTDLEPEWLRSRIYYLAQRQVTVDAKTVFIRDVRTLVMLISESIEPVRFNNPIK